MHRGRSLVKVQKVFYHDLRNAVLDLLNQISDL